MEKQLAGMRKNIVDIFQAGLRAVDPAAAIKRFCSVDHNILRVDDRDYNLALFTRIVILGAGKAGAAMAGAIEEILAEHITEGLVVVKYDHVLPLARVRLVEAGHPLPDANGVAGADALLELAAQCDEKTLVICLISGGGSSLLPCPVDGVSLEDKQQTTGALLDCGADIHEINTVRKHLSKIKGGGLAKAVFPATLVCLMLSDVVGDDFDTIASGPCVADSTTYAQCAAIFEKYAIKDKIPLRVQEHIQSGVTGLVAETPKQGASFFNKVHCLVVGCNYEALVACKQKAKELGYNTLLLSSTIEGETSDAASFHMALAREITRHNEPVRAPACLLSGGETTVTIKGCGKGGRNQEFVLASAMQMQGMTSTVVFSAGTDGSDGPTDAAGAITDSSVGERARALGLEPKEYLDNNDSYQFFAALDDLYKTGPTNTNVMDVRIILVGG
jgi:hydroxypyruvate reductase